MPRRKGALPPARYRALMLSVYERDGWRCRQCGSRRNLTPHHISRRSQGGADVLENLVCLCLQCHELRHVGGRKKGIST